MKKFQTIIPNILTICTYSEFAPFSYKKDGRVTGTDIELLENFAVKMGLDVNIIEKQYWREHFCGMDCYDALDNRWHDGY